MSLLIASRNTLSSIWVLLVPGVAVLRLVWPLRPLRRSVLGRRLGLRHPGVVNREKEICGVATPALGQVRWLPVSSRGGFARSRPTAERRRMFRSPVNLVRRRWSGFPGSTRGWPASSSRMSSVGLMIFVVRYMVERRSVALLRSFRRGEQTGEIGEG